MAKCPCVLFFAAAPCQHPDTVHVTSNEADLLSRAPFSPSNLSSLYPNTVLVSHKWLRPAFPAPPHHGRDGHPDDSDNSKCKLIIAALDNLRKGPHPPVPADHQFAIWIDYSCLDQDNREYQNFDEVFQLIIKRCDIVLTPIVDPDWNSWGKETPKKLPAGGWLKAYQAAGWQQYLNRGWCRVEMMLNAAFGVDMPEDRAKSFNGKLKLSLIAGRRPHVIFGTREMAQQSTPLFLDPVKHDTFEVFAPAKGPLTDEAGGPSPDLELGHVVHIIGLKGPEGARYNDTCGKLVRYNDVKGRWDVKVASAFAYENPQLTANCISLPGSYIAPVSVDRARIVTFEHIARRHWPKQETGWVLNDRWNYDGKNADKEDVGYGKRIYKDGRVYEGECRGSHPDGIGRMIETNGEVFAGQYSAGKKEGTGTYVFSSGAVYEGEWSRDVQHGFGCYTWPDGELDRSQYANGAKTGEGVRLSADRSKAWILTQGKKGKSISLKEAKQVELACRSMSYRKK